MILGALHLVGGGSLEARCLPCPPAVTPCFNIVLWAAATENGWLAPGGCHCRALSVIHRGLITVNRRDPALRRYRRVILSARQRALGFTGIRGPYTCFSHGGSLCELDVTHLVGRRHDFDRYVCSDAIMSHTARMACCCWCW
jgi:hypothetical protein